ncbi:MAG: ATPase, T2SS/T4P/T4SS family [Actinomycetota bacterium]
MEARPVEESPPVPLFQKRPAPPHPQDAPHRPPSPPAPQTQGALPRPRRAAQIPASTAAADPAHPPGSRPPRAALAAVVPARRGSGKEPIGATLVKLGYITQAQLDAALARQRADGRRVGDLLVAEQTISRDQLGRAMAHRAGVDFYTLADGVDTEVAQLIDERSARRYSAVPVRRDPDGTIVVAMADPANVFAIDDIRILLRADVRAVLAMPDDIRELLSYAGAIDHVVADIIEETIEADGPAETGQADISLAVDDAPVVRLVNSLIARAVDERASDIHFEPQGGEMVVRYRIDGVLRQVTSVPRRMAGGLVSRIKIMADLDIAEKRVPQDGRIGLNVGGRSLDMRVASLPTVYGEKVVMRVLDKSNVLLKLSELGFTADTLGRFEGGYRRPYGAVLVTGPTGSGKSTTLYAALNQVNSKEKNIITVEDPVEYRLPGVNQVQVNQKAGLTFAAGLRSILRCDPDIVMIGEVRDRETAQIAIESALTGHLVLATIHTNDSAGGLTRLAEMGVEPFLSASAVVTILAQRLARRLCPHCREQTTVSHAVLRDAAGVPSLPRGLPDPAPVYRARGCPRCSDTGYRGRLGVFEVLSMSEEIERLTVAGASSEEIRRQARREGMRTMREDGLLKVLSGHTTLEELARAVG